WYGPTSGEYWRVNPREYADPRKHGPEYQSRARRQSTTAGEAWDGSGEAAEPLGPSAAASEQAGAFEPEAGDDPPPFGEPRPDSEPAFAEPGLSAEGRASAR